MNSNGFIPSISDEKGFSPRRRDKPRAEQKSLTGTARYVPWLPWPWIIGFAQANGAS